MKSSERIFLRQFGPSWLALILNLPLVFSNLALGSFDAYTHIFFADHYRRTWFDLLEPKWFGGFSVASYPPLVHQLIAIVSVPATALTSLSSSPENISRFWSEVLAYDLLLLIFFACIPLAVEGFARIFVPRRAARTAGWLAVGLPSLYLAAYSFGQLPTLIATTALLWALRLGWQFTKRGHWHDLALAMLWAGVTAAAHHAVLLLAVLAGAAMLGKVLAQPLTIGARLRQTGRLVLFAICAAGLGALVLWPFIVWSAGYVAQTPIDHASRHNFFLDMGASYYFFWPMYGPILLALPVMIGWTAKRRLKRLRHWPLVALATLLFILSLGGTTPLPALLFGVNWAWLTYDRFGLWAGLALLPLAGLLWQVYRRRVVRLVWAGLLVPFCIFGASIAVGSHSQPPVVDVAAIANFLDTQTAGGERYLTLGMGDQLARLSVLTKARTIDGTYFTARAIPELRVSGLGELDGAMWNPAGAEAIQPFLEKGAAWGLRWAFNANNEYVPILQAAGWQLRGTIAPSVQVWYNPAPTMAVDWQMPVEVDWRAGLWWGLAPIAILALALTCELSLRYEWRWWGMLVAGLFILWPFFYNQLVWSQTVAGVYYTYTSGLIFLGDVLAAMLVAGVAFTGRWKAGALSRLGRGIRWAVGALMAFVFLSVPFSIAPTLSLTFGLHLVAVGVLAGTVAWVLPQLDWRIIAGALTVGLLVQSGVAIAEAVLQNTVWLQGLGLMWPGPLSAATQGASVVGLANGARWLRAYGTLPHPNILGGYLVVTLAGPLLGYLKTGKVRWLWPSLTGVGALLLTFSRAGWVAGGVMAVVLVLWLPQAYRRRVVAALVGAGVLGLALAVGLSALVWVRATGSGESVREVSSTLERIELARLAFDYFREKPLVGGGAATFPVMMMQHGEISGEPVHNIALLALAETGLGGGAAVVALGLAIGWVAWRRRGLSLMNALATAALFGLLTISLFDHFLWSLSTGRLWLALVVGWWLGSLEVVLRVDHARLAGTVVEEAISPEGQQTKDEGKAAEDAEELKIGEGRKGGEGGRARP